MYRARGATLKVGGGGGGGGLNSDSKWGGWKHLFLSNSLKFPKKWGGWSPPQPLPLRGPWCIGTNINARVPNSTLCIAAASRLIFFMGGGGKIKLFSPSLFSLSCPIKCGLNFSLTTNIWLSVTQQQRKQQQQHLFFSYMRQFTEFDFTRRKVGLIEAGEQLHQRD